MSTTIAITPYDLMRRPYQDTPDDGRRYDFGPADMAGRDAPDTDIRLPEGWQLVKSYLRDGNLYVDVAPAPQADLTYADVARFLGACMGPDARGNRWPRDDNWTQGAYARNASGDPVTASDPNAISWCAQGRMAAVAMEILPYPIQNRIRAAANEMVATAAGAVNSVVGWQDKPDITAVDVARAFARGRGEAFAHGSLPLPPPGSAVVLDAAAIAALPDRGTGRYRYYILCPLGANGAEPDDVAYPALPPEYRFRRVFPEDGYLVAEIRPHSKALAGQE